jgi:hypothetical protein
MEVRALVSASDSSQAWGLRCDVREKLIKFIAENYPGALPRRRWETTEEPGESENPEESG